MLPSQFSLSSSFFNILAVLHSMWDVTSSPNQGSNLGPLHWQRDVLTTGPPRKSHNSLLSPLFLMNISCPGLQWLPCSSSQWPLLQPPPSWLSAVFDSWSFSLPWSSFFTSLPGHWSSSHTSVEGSSVTARHPLLLPPSSKPLFNVTGFLTSFTFTEISPSLAIISKLWALPPHSSLPF